VSGGSATGIVKPPPAGRAVALTGARTFLGRNLVGLLEEDETVRRVVVLDVARPPTAGLKTRAYEVDLTLPAAAERVGEILAAERVDTLLHLAFLSSPTPASAWAHELEALGTIHLLRGARLSPPGHLVLASHTLLYGASSSNPAFLDETRPLAAPAHEPFFADKMAAEDEVARFASEQAATVVTVLRAAPIVGPTVRSFMTRWLAQRLSPTLLGFDPMWQLVHEIDAVVALKIAVDHPVRGTFNIVGDGVLPLSKVLRVAGRAPLPIPHPIARAAMASLWAAGRSAWPPSFAPYLRYGCVADGARAAAELGFVAAYGPEEAVLDFMKAQRLRDARLVEEAEA
jgi:UDP-glucose 4-epimerase